MQEPLAFRMRPEKLDDIIGQEHILHKDSFLRKMIRANRLMPMLLVGPPGVGKTTIAKTLANEVDLPFFELNAVMHGKKDLEKVVKEIGDDSAVVYISEIHRLNKNVQEYLLPVLESGHFIMVGSTTESVAHEIKPAIRSRCQIFELKALTEEDVKKGLKRALKDEERGFGKQKIDISDEALKHIALISGGDMRQALNYLEAVILSSDENEDGVLKIELEKAEEVVQRKSMHEAGSGSTHYDILSNFQKAIRGSDVDAALVCLAILIDAGDLKSIHRRLLVISYEDCFADSTVHQKVLTAIEASERVGLPEARIPLAAAVIELCLAPKSNSAYKAIDAALAVVRSGKKYEVPDHLKDSHYKDAKKLGYGVGYLYPHDYRGYVKQNYLPDDWLDYQFYHPNPIGDEKRLASRYEKIRGFLRNS